MVLTSDEYQFKDSELIGILISTVVKHIEIPRVMVVMTICR